MFLPPPTSHDHGLPSSGGFSDVRAGNTRELSVPLGSRVGAGSWHWLQLKLGAKAHSGLAPTLAESGDQINGGQRPPVPQRSFWSWPSGDTPTQQGRRDPWRHHTTAPADQTQDQNPRVPGGHRQKGQMCTRSPAAQRPRGLSDPSRPLQVSKSLPQAKPSHWALLSQLR